MKKRIAWILTLAMLLSVLAGCAGTTVVVGNCTCPADSHEAAAPAVTEPEAEMPAAALKTGLAVVTDLSGSSSADAETEGQAKFDVTVVAVTVDGSGVIRDCIIDSLAASVKFDAAGSLTSDVTAEVKTKNELGEAYGMKAYAGSKYEWNEQAAALAAYAVGKTVEELKSGAVDETGHAADADLASTATISIGGYVSSIETAVANAQALGAQTGDELRLAVISSLDGSASADGEKAGAAQLDCNVAAITISGDIITSCCIDSLQAKVSFDAAGAITSDVTAGAQTKNELGEAYGLKAYAGSQYEWNEQAANFAAYVTGKTAEEVAGIAVNEKTAPTDADLASSVTIAIGGFQALIAKAINSR